MGIPSQAGPDMKTVGALAAALVLIAAPAAPQTQMIVVTGLGGDDAHRQRFHQWASLMVEAARERIGMPKANVHYLGPRPETDPQLIDAKSTKENIVQLLDSLANEMEAAAQLFILLIGHGSSQGDDARFSLPGPDMSDHDFANALGKFPSQEIVFVNTASASGGFIKTLSAPNRTIVTATKSPFERNATLFGQYFVEAFARDGADVDKDERVSVYEAFDYARREVSRLYEQENRLLTEHALLDDNGDGEGSSELDPVDGDGALARRAFLRDVAETVVIANTDDPELAALLTTRRELQNQIADLRSKSEQLDRAAYERELERLLLELARTSQAIRAREKEKQP